MLEKTPNSRRLDPVMLIRFVAILKGIGIYQNGTPDARNTSEGLVPGCLKQGTRLFGLASCVPAGSRIYLACLGCPSNFLDIMFDKSIVRVHLVSLGCGLSDQGCGVYPVNENSLSDFWA